MGASTRTTQGQDLKDGQKVCDFKMFKNLGLSLEYLDASALEMVRNNKNLLLVNIFPSAIGNNSEVENLLTKHSKIRYSKNIDLNSNGALNYMFQLYKDEHWAGDFKNNFAGFREKQSLCFNSPGPLRTYLIEVNDLAIAKLIKEEVRLIFGIGNHSIHINDTHEETLRLSRCLFNGNSIHFLNNSVIANYENFAKYLNFYEQFINDNGLNSEDYCITASGVLALYGLREAADLDYIHGTSQIIEDPKNNVNSHNEYGLDLYDKTYDDIIYNPANHFYFGNLKVASLDIIKDLKTKRNESKDKVDVNLIESIY